MMEDDELFGADGELFAAETRSDWKRVVEILEREGRLNDAKTVRKSFPYAMQQARLAWEDVKKGILTALGFGR